MIPFLQIDLLVSICPDPILTGVSEETPTWVVYNVTIIIKLINIQNAVMENWDIVVLFSCHHTWLDAT